MLRSLRGSRLRQRELWSVRNPLHRRDDLSERRVRVLRRNALQRRLHRHLERPGQLWSVRHGVHDGAGLLVGYVHDGVWDRSHGVRQRLRRPYLGPVRLRCMQHRVRDRRDLRHQRLQLRRRDLALRGYMRGSTDKCNGLRQLRRPLSARRDLLRGGVRGRLRDGRNVVQRSVRHCGYRHTQLRDVRERLRTRGDVRWGGVCLLFRGDRVHWDGRPGRRRERGGHLHGPQ